MGFLNVVKMQLSNNVRECALKRNGLVNYYLILLLYIIGLVWIWTAFITDTRIMQTWWWRITESLTTITAYVRNNEATLENQSWITEKLNSSEVYKPMKKPSCCCLSWSRLKSNVARFGSQSSGSSVWSFNDWHRLDRSDVSLISHWSPSAGS